MWEERQVSATQTEDAVVLFAVETIYVSTCMYLSVTASVIITADLCSPPERCSRRLSLGDRWPQSAVLKLFSL